MLEIRAIKVKNFGSFASAEFLIDTNMVYVVTGKNGSGKSTLFAQALGFAFYNKTVKEDMPIEQVIRDGSDFCKVTVVTDKGTLTVVRNRKGATERKLDGKDVNLEDISVWLGCDSDIFFNSVIFRQGFGGFVYFRDADKRAFITKISLGYIDEYLETVNATIKELGGKQQRVAERLASFTEELRFNKKNIKTMQREYKGWKRGQRKDKEEELRNLKKEIKGIEKELVEVKKDMMQLRKQGQKAEEELDNYITSVSSYEKIDRDIFIDLRTVQGKLDAVTQEIENLRNLKGTCPTCKQKVSRDVLIKPIEVLEEKRRQLREKIAKLQEKRVNEKDRAEYYKKRVKESNSEVTTISNKYISTDNKRGILSSKLAYLQSVLQKTSSDTVKEYPGLSSLNEAKENAEKLLKKKGEIEKELQNILDRYKVYQFMQEKIRVYRNDMFNGVVDLLNPITNKYLASVTNDKFTLNIVSELANTGKRTTDRFKLNVLSGSKVIPFGRLSGGEKQQVAVSINLALIEIFSTVLSNDINLLVLDEVFDGLDVTAKEKVLGVVQDLQKETKKAVILITHDDLSFAGGKDYKHIHIVTTKKNQSKITGG